MTWQPFLTRERLPNIPKNQYLMSQVIKRGILQAFYPATYTADVLLLEATSNFLSSMPIATSVGPGNAIAGAFCAVLFFDEHNPNDAVIIAVYPNTTQGVPARFGSVFFTTPNAPISSSVINAGVTTTYTIGGTGGIPTKAMAALVKAYFTSPTINSYIDLAPHSGNLAGHISIGNLPAANAYLNGVGILQLDANGQIDIRATTGNCTVTVWTYGYVN